MYIPLPNRYIRYLEFISRKCDFRGSFGASRANDWWIISEWENITLTVKIQHFQKQCFLIYMLNSARWWRPWDPYSALGVSRWWNSTKISIIEQFSINDWVHRPSNRWLSNLSLSDESLPPSLVVYTLDRGPGLCRRMSVSLVGSRRSWIRFKLVSPLERE